MMFKFTINPKNANQLPSTNLLQEQKFSGRCSLNQLLWFLWAHSCIPQLATWMSTWSISHYVSLPESSYVPGCVAASLLVGLDCLLLSLPSSHVTRRQQTICRGWWGGALAGISKGECRGGGSGSSFTQERKPEKMPIIGDGKMPTTNSDASIPTASKSL